MFVCFQGVWVSLIHSDVPMQESMQSTQPPTPVIFQLSCFSIRACCEGLLFFPALNVLHGFNTFSQCCTGSGRFAPLTHSSPPWLLYFYVINGAERVVQFEKPRRPWHQLKCRHPSIWTSGSRVLWVPCTVACPIWTVECTQGAEMPVSSVAETCSAKDL